MIDSQELDELDRGIAKLLAKDGRMPFSEIAQELNVTEKTVRSRYKNLIDKNVLKVSGIVNPISLGIKVEAIIQISVHGGSLDEVVEGVKKFDRVRFITLTTGEYELLVQVNTSDYDELTKLAKDILNVKGIAKTNTMVQLEVYKNTFEYL